MFRPTLSAATRSFSNTAPRTPISSATSRSPITNTDSSRSAWQAYRAAETARLSSFRLEHLHNPHTYTLPTMLEYQYTAFNSAALRMFKEDREMHIASRGTQKTENEKEILAEVSEGMWVKVWIRSTNGSRR